MHFKSVYFKELLISTANFTFSINYLRFMVFFILLSYQLILKLFIIIVITMVFVIEQLKLFVAVNVQLMMEVILVVHAGPINDELYFYQYAFKLLYIKLLSKEQQMMPSKMKEH